MKKTTKTKLLLAAAALVMSGLLFILYFVRAEKNMKDTVISIEAESKIETEEAMEGEIFYSEKNPAAFAKQPGTALYEAAFESLRSASHYLSYYIEEGTLFLDETRETGEFDEEGLAIYETKNRQKIAENVRYVDCNSYKTEAGAIYITTDHVLKGTGEYENIYMENVKFARCYADQMIVLKQDNSVWCRGKSYSLSDGRWLAYKEWKYLLSDVAYATLGHNIYLAVKRDGSLYMWGDNTYGQFGDGSLLASDPQFSAETYFFEEPTKVADDIKMVWAGELLKQYTAIEGEWLRTYMLTNKGELFVCGEEVNDQERTFFYFGEIGESKEGVTIQCTSRLIPVALKR